MHESRGGGVAEWFVGGSMAREGGVSDLERLGRGLASLDMTWAGRAGHDLGLAYNFGFGVPSHARVSVWAMADSHVKNGRGKHGLGGAGLVGGRGRAWACRGTWGWHMVVASWCCMDSALGMGKVWLAGSFVHRNRCRELVGAWRGNVLVVDLTDSWRDGEMWRQATLSGPGACVAGGIERSVGRGCPKGHSWHQVLGQYDMEVDVGLGRAVGDGEGIG